MTSADEVTTELETLLQRIRLKGDEEAIHELVTRFHRHVYLTAYAVLRSPPEAEEVAQEALWKAIRKLHTLEETGAFPAWLTTLTTRLAIDRARKQTRQTAVSLESVENSSDTSSSHHVHPADRLILEEALSALTPEHRAALMLHVRDGFAYEEIAHLLRIPVGTVKSRIAYAKKTMRTILRQGEEE